MAVTITYEDNELQLIDDEGRDLMAVLDPYKVELQFDLGWPHPQGMALARLHIAVCRVQCSDTAMQILPGDPMGDRLAIRPRRPVASTIHVDD